MTIVPYEYECAIPEGTAGDWKVERFEVSESDADFHNLRCALNPHHSAGREVFPGIFTRLVYMGKVVMSNTPAEMEDMKCFIRRANGHVLITGLGLGLVTEQVVKKPEILSVTVIEKSKEVSDLIIPHIRLRKEVNTVIYSGDALTYNLGVIRLRLKELKIDKFDFAWNDIWNYISAENLKDFSRLKRHYGRYVKEQLFWCERECLRAKRSILNGNSI